MPDALNFKNVDKSYGSHAVFRGLNYCLQLGERVAFLGANGAGKSTFLGLAGGLLRPDKGEVNILSLDAGDFSLRHRVRFLTQDLVFPAQLTAREVLNISRIHFRASWPKRLIEELEIDVFLERRAGVLSGGEARRLALANALIGDPELILLDEPTSSLDLKGQRAMQGVLMEHLKRTGATLIFSSHRMSEVELLADRISVINHGRMLADGPTKSIRDQFGMSKVTFQTDRSITKLNSARSLRHSGQKYEVMGPDSDSILRELIESFPDARDFSVAHAPLEEIILHLWSKEGN